jgi:hypothetical protein
MLTRQDTLLAELGPSPFAVISEAVPCNERVG